MKDEIIQDDRGIIEDGRAHAQQRAQRTKAFLGIIGLSVCGYLVWTVWSPDDDKTKLEVPKEGTIKQLEAFQAAPPAPLEAVPPVFPVEEIKLPTPIDEPEEKSDPLLDAARRAPVLAFSGQGSGRGNIQGNNSYIDAPEAPNPDAEKFNNLMKPTTLEGMRAGYLGNRNFIIAMGSSIPCILETALNSDQPGFASCIINRDILSDNGRIVLLDKGTQVVGEYKAGLQKGQRRLFVLWTRAKTPNGVIITLASPATDAIGRAGFDGRVNKHWWERFGSSILLSVIGDASRYLVDRANNNQSIQLQDTSNSGKEAASIALENQINIPPTLEKHQGELVNILVARDLDFSGVYKLKVTEDQMTVYDRAIFGNFDPNSKIVKK